jgi:hypothetical protein
MKHPCELTEFFEHADIVWNSTIKCYDNLDHKERLNIPFASVVVEKMSKLEYLTEFKNINLNEYHSNANLIILRANLDYIKPLSENILLKEQILSLGFVDKIENFKMVNIFQKIYNRLFKLTPKLEKKYDSFKKYAKSNQGKLFCAQIRIGGKHEIYNYTDRKFTERNNSRLYWDFIRKNIIVNEVNYKIFITTDTESVAEEAIEEFGKDKVIMIDGNYIHIDVAFAYHQHKCESYEKTILDFHAFQLCDKAVISQGGYGLMANYLRPDPFKELYRYTEIFENNSLKINFMKISNLNDLDKNENEGLKWLKRIKEVK